MQDKLEIIVIDRDEFLRDFVVKAFNRDSAFNAVGVSDYKEFYERLKSDKFYLIVADGDEKEAYEFARELRSDGNNTPIILYFDINSSMAHNVLDRAILGIDTMTKPIQMADMRNMAANCIWKYLKGENLNFKEGTA